MAQDRALTPGQDRRHPSPLIAQAPVPDRVDAPVNAVQPPRVHALRDRRSAHPARELSDRDDAVLPGDPGRRSSRLGVGVCRFPYGQLSRQRPGFAPVRRIATPHGLRLRPVLGHRARRARCALRAAREAHRRRSPRPAGRCRASTSSPAPAARASGCASSRSTPATRRTGRRSCARSARPAAPGSSTTSTAPSRCTAAARSSSTTSTR